MTATTCAHGYPSPLSCIDCMNDEGVGAPPPELVTVEAISVAKYETGCARCDDPVYEGDAIALLSSGPWVHERCARDG